MKKYLKSAVPFLLIIAAFTVFIVFEFIDVTFCKDELTDRLLNETVPRLVAGAALTAVMAVIGCKRYLLINFKRLPGDLLWCIPCFLVVIANFPFTAVFSGEAQILRSDLIWLFILKCVSIALMEEMLFRGLVLDTLKQYFENKKHSALATVAVSSAIFALFHLLNLFSGANVGATFLQVGYSFLIGAMLAAVVVKTQNIWLCVILHTVFDFGGYFVTDLGTGSFQDLWFWIFTAVAGVICLVHIVYYLIKCEKTVINEN